MTEEEAGKLILDKRGWVECQGLCEQLYPPGTLNDCEERGQLCDECREETKPMPIPCGWHGCTNTTYYDDTYGNLCYQHVRAEDD